MDLALLTKKSNSLVDKYNYYNNVVIGSVTSPGLLRQLYTAYGLSHPPALAEIQALTPKQRGGLLAGLSGILGAMGKETTERTFEQDIIGCGYATPQAAIADLDGFLAGLTPEQLSGDIPQKVQQIKTVIQQTIEILTALDAFADAEFIVGIVAKIISIETAVATIANQIRKV